MSPSSRLPSTLSSTEQPQRGAGGEVGGGRLPQGYRASYIPTACCKSCMGIATCFQHLYQVDPIPTAQSKDGAPSGMCTTRVCCDPPPSRLLTAVRRLSTAVRRCISLGTYATNELITVSMAASLYSFTPSQTDGSRTDRPCYFVAHSPVLCPFLASVAKQPK